MDLEKIRLRVQLIEYMDSQSMGIITQILHGKFRQRGSSGITEIEVKRNMIEMEVNRNRQTNNNNNKTVH